jgi:mitotic spindle assembly checkpoint protein MAD1
VSELAKQVGHWRGLVERYGGSTTEIVDLEELEERRASPGPDDTGVIVGKSLEEQLRLNEALREGELTVSVLDLPSQASDLPLSA